MTTNRLNPEPRTLNPAPCPTWNAAKHRLIAAGQWRALLRLLSRDFSLSLCDLLEYVRRERPHVFCGGDGPLGATPEYLDFLADYERLGLCDGGDTWLHPDTREAVKDAILALRQRAEPQARGIALAALADALDCIQERQAALPDLALRFFSAAETFAAAIRGIRSSGGPPKYPPAD